MYIPEDILAYIKIVPESGEEQLQLNGRKKEIEPKMMLQKIGQMIAHVESDNR